MKHNIATSDLHKKPNTKKRKLILVPINKVSLQTKENDMGNTTLSMEFNDCKAIAILNLGAGVSIATKSL